MLNTKKHPPSRKIKKKNLTLEVFIIKCRTQFVFYVELYNLIYFPPSRQGLLYVARITCRGVIHLQKDMS